MILRNVSHEKDIAAHVEACFDLLSRCRGLLGRDSLPVGHGVWLKPCQSIHTFFMRFPIDIIFVNKSLKIVALKKHVPPWRIVGPYFRAHSAIELSAGTIEASDLKIGYQLACGS